MVYSAEHQRIEGYFVHAKNCRRCAHRWSSSTAIVCYSLALIAFLVILSWCLGWFEEDLTGIATGIGKSDHGRYSEQERKFMASTFPRGKKLNESKRALPQHLIGVRARTYTEQRKTFRQLVGDTRSLSCGQRVTRFFRRLWRKYEVKIKIFIEFLQISTSMPFNLGVEFSSPFHSVLEFWGFALSPVPALGLMCSVSKFDYISTVLVVTLTPLAGLLVIYFAAGVSYFRSGGDIKTLTFYSWMVFLLSFYVFVSVSSTLFQYFKCETYALPDGNSRRYLVADLQVDVSDPIPLTTAGRFILNNFLT